MNLEGGDEMGAETSNLQDDLINRRMTDGIGLSSITEHSSVGMNPMIL